jgi:hypothetical protein
LLAKFKRLRAGMSFAEGGLRLKLGIGPEPERTEKEATKELPKGEILATAAELTPIEVGFYTRFEGEGPDGPATASSRIAKVTREGDSVSIAIDQTYKSDEDDYTGTDYQLLEGSLLYVKSSDDDGHTTYDVPQMELPAELIAGMHKVHPFSADAVYGEEDSDQSRMIGENEIKVIGLETVKVPAGLYEDCVRVEFVTRSVNAGYFSKTKSVYWYAKKVGMVKYESESSGRTTTMELVEAGRRPAGEKEK